MVWEGLSQKESRGLNNENPILAETFRQRKQLLSRPGILHKLDAKLQEAKYRKLLVFLWEGDMF